MNRRLVICVTGITLVLLIWNLQIFGSGSVGSFLDFILTVVVIYRAYVAYKRSGDSTARPQVRLISQTVNDTPTHLAIVAGIVVFILATAGYQVFSAGAVNFFVWGDHLLGMADGNHPIVVWALAGLLFGAAAGALVIWLKYHISFRWCLAAMGPFLLLVFLLQVNGDPLRSIPPRPVVSNTDTAQTRSPAPHEPIPVRKRQPVTQSTAIQDTPKQSPVAAPSCATELGAVSINARTDSVNIYYRTAEVQNGPWSAWKAKLVPQQGQFSLTSEAPVRANSLQYYYEVRSVRTRSAQSPFTLTICDGPLVIETY